MKNNITRLEIFIGISNILFLFKNKIKNKKLFIALGFIFLISLKYLTWEIDKYDMKGLLEFDLVREELKFLYNENKNYILKLGEYLINIPQLLDIYLGIISILITIYIYSISLGDDFKKYVLLILLGEGKVLYLTISILFLYFLNISPVLFFSLIFIIFYEILKMIKEIFLIMNTIRFKENWNNKIIPRLKKSENLENVYYELRKRITKAMLEEDFIVFEEMLFYYKELLKTNDFLVPDNFLTKEEREQDKTIVFLYEIYNYLIENKNDNLYDVISYLNIELGNYYLSINKLKEAEYCFDILLLKYKYLSNSKKEDKGFHLFEGLRFYVMDNLSEEKQIIILKSILKLFDFLIKNDKYEELKEYHLILGTEYSLGNNILKDYCVIILIYLLKINDKPKDKDKETRDNLISELQQYFYFNKASILEKIYTESEKNNWEDKLNLHIYTMEDINVLGSCTGVYNPSDIKKIIFQLLDKNIARNINKDFILDNIDYIETIYKELPNISDNILVELTPKIRMKKAERISKIQITEREKEDIYSSINEEETEFFKFLKDNICEKIISKNLDNEDWEKLFKGYRQIYPNEIIMEVRNLADQYINILNESFFTENITNKSILTNKEILQKKQLKEYFLISGLNKRKYLKNLNINIYYLKNYMFDDILLINRNSIKEIIFYLPKNYRRMKYSYIDIESLKNNKDEKILEKISGETREEKELIMQGSSILKIAKKMEIIFNKNIEIYKISEKLLK